MIYKGALSRKQEVRIHILFWSFMAYLTLVVFDTTNGNSLRLMEIDLFGVTGAIIFILTFYLNYLFLLPFTFKPFKWTKALISIVGLFAFFIVLRYLIEQKLTVALFDTQNYYDNFSLAFYILDNIYYGSFPIIASSFLWIIIFVIRLLHYNQQIIEEQKNTEIKFLKAQINPHFIFNTLNNIYSMVYFKSDKSLPAIEKLSQIMRFTTYESQKEKIKLSEEINYIKAYIELEQLRHEEQYTVNLDLPSNETHVEIPPYILSPFVENALKHGKATVENPIEIKLTRTKTTLNFVVKNEISTNKKDKLGGIGLENLKKRLELYYPKSHNLELSETDNVFIAQLEIQLR